jgi:hypothetical protein
MDFLSLLTWFAGWLFWILRSFGCQFLSNPLLFNNSPSAAVP